MSNLFYSFKDWCVDNNKDEYLRRWDTKSNKCSPTDTAFMSNRKYYFLCPRGIHESEAIRLYDITGGKNSVRCKKCNSFAQYIIDTYSEEYLSFIWNDDNPLSPWDLSAHSKKKCIFNCENDSDHVYYRTLDHFTDGYKCPFCSHQKIHPKDSLGKQYPAVLEIWSDKKTKSPYEYAPISGKKAWFKCGNGIHEDYERKISASQEASFRCPECGKIQSHNREKEDLSKQTFGELTPLYIDKEMTKKTAKTHWVCKCSCGNFTVSSLSNLKRGISTTCGNRMIHYSGENNGNWQGGITPLNRKERMTPSYNEWRQSVYKKDNYICQCCGVVNPLGLSAHHILNFSTHKALRYDLKNGISLCSNCHNPFNVGSFHNIYGTLNNTPEQLEEYINRRRKELGINVRFSMKEYLEGKVFNPNQS